MPGSGLVFGTGKRPPAVDSGVRLSFGTETGGPAAPDRELTDAYAVLDAGLAVRK